MAPFLVGWSQRNGRSTGGDCSTESGSRARLQLKGKNARWIDGTRQSDCARWNRAEPEAAIIRAVTDQNDYADTMATSQFQAFRYELSSDPLIDERGIHCQRPEKKRARGAADRDFCKAQGRDHEAI